MKQEIYRLDDLKAILKVSKSTIYLMMNNNKFPKPSKLSKNINVWKSSDVQLWIEQNI